MKSRYCSRDVGNRLVGRGIVRLAVETCFVSMLYNVVMRVVDCVMIGGGLGLSEDETRKYKSINVLRGLMRRYIVRLFVQLATCIVSSWAVERLLPLGWRDKQLSLRNLSDIRAIAFVNLSRMFKARQGIKMTT